MRMSSKAYRLLFLLVAVTMIMGQFAAVMYAEEDEEEPNIVLVSHGSCAWDAFWCVVEQGNYDAAEDLGVNFTLIAADKWDPERTAQDIDKALAMEPDALGVTVTDGVLFEEPMLRAIDSGIPVMAYNTADMRPKEERIPYIAFVGLDENTGGRLAGQKIVADHPDATRGVCVNHVVGHVGVDARCKGFIEALDEAGIPAEVLAIPTEDMAAAATVMDDYHTSNPDVDVWFTVGPQASTPFYAFFDNAGLQPGDIVHVASALSEEDALRIADGTTEWTIDFGPYASGYLTVQYLTWAAKYGILPPTDYVATGPGVMDASNIDLVLDLAGTYR